jgi:hypothetical protein
MDDRSPSDNSQCRHRSFSDKCTLLINGALGMASLGPSARSSEGRHPATLLTKAVSAPLPPADRWENPKNEVLQILRFVFRIEKERDDHQSYCERNPNNATPRPDRCVENKPSADCVIDLAARGSRRAAG